VNGSPDRDEPEHLHSRAVPVEVEVDPYQHDPLHWGASMAHHTDVMLRLFDAVGALSVVEVGAYAGDLTRVLVQWAEQTGGAVTAIDPAPQPALVSLAQAHAGLELIRQTSLASLGEIELPDVVIIDGDHNYYTVSEELRLIASRAAGARLPLLLFHDVSWPHARRDDYFDVEQIPADYRQPLVGERAGIVPDDPGTHPDGLPYHKSADHEGGPRNGVLTAIEDFAAGDDQLRLAVVPAFFGFGAVWHAGAPWAAAAGAILEPLDGDRLIAGLESNRVGHIAGEHELRNEIWRLQERIARQEQVLRRLLDSSAFAVAERLSLIRVKAGVAPDQSVVSRAQIRRALSDPHDR
jgi:hypothetical protein